MKKTVSIIMAGLLCAAVLTSCDNPQRAADSASGGYVPKTEAANDEEAESRAERIVNIVRNMDGVDDAAVTVNGGTAIVAVSLAGDLDDKALIALKKLIKANVKRADPMSRRVAVSGAAEAFDDIKGGEGKEETLPSAVNDELFINTVPKF